MNQELLKKLKAIEKKISDIKGDFKLFAIFLREDSPSKWDLVLAAPWLKRGDMNTLKFIADVVKKELNDDLLQLSGIVVLDMDNPNLKALNVFQVKHGSMELKDVNLFGMEIKNANLITSQV